jgi:hypothetical protein
VHVFPQLINIPVTTTGVYVSTAGNSNPTSRLGAPGRVVAWSLSTAPSDASGGLYVSEVLGGLVSASDMATAVSNGTAIQLDVGEAVQTPANHPGPYELQLSITAVSGIAQARLTVWYER